MKRHLPPENTRQSLNHSKSNALIKNYVKVIENICNSKTAIIQWHKSRNKVDRIGVRHNLFTVWLENIFWTMKWEGMRISIFKPSTICKWHFTYIKIIGWNTNDPNKECLQVGLTFRKNDKNKGWRTKRCPGMNQIRTGDKIKGEP